MRTEQKWSRDEREYLRMHYGTRPASDVARSMGRTASSVRSTAYKLGLAGKATYVRCDAWTKEEVEFLREHFYTEKTAYIAKRLGRTPHSVARKRKDLGMPEKVVYRIEDRPTTDELLAMYGSMTAPEIARRYGWKVNTVRSWIERAL